MLHLSLFVRPWSRATGWAAQATVARLFVRWELFSSCRLHFVSSSTSITTRMDRHLNPLPLRSQTTPFDHPHAYNLGFLQARGVVFPFAMSYFDLPQQCHNLFRFVPLDWD